MEENSNFSKMAEEKLQCKMEQIKENRDAHLAAMIERLQEKVWYAGICVVKKKRPQKVQAFQTESSQVWELVLMVDSSLFRRDMQLWCAGTKSWGKSWQHEPHTSSDLHGPSTSLHPVPPPSSPCPHPPENSHPTLEVKRFEDLTTTSQHTTPPVLTSISIISGYKHQ